MHIRTLQPEDRGLLRRGFEHLTTESRYRRFLGVVSELSEHDLDYLTRIDHHDHEALVAIDESTGDIVAVARYVRLPEEASVAEVAVTVADEWQGHGVGTLILSQLAERARNEGVARFRGLILSHNVRMIDLMKEVGPITVGRQEAGTVEVESDISAARLIPDK